MKESLRQVELACSEFSDGARYCVFCSARLTDSRRSGPQMHADACPLTQLIAQRAVLNAVRKTRRNMANCKYTNDIDQGLVALSSQAWELDCELELLESPCLDWLKKIIEGYNNYEIR